MNLYFFSADITTENSNCRSFTDYYKDEFKEDAVPPEDGVFEVEKSNCKQSRDGTFTEVLHQIAQYREISYVFILSQHSEISSF